MSQAGLVNVEENNPQIPTSFPTNVGTAVPLANELEILGTGSVTTTGVGNVVTISVTGSLPWHSVNAGTTLVPNNAYMCTGGGAINLALPAVSAFGDEIIILLSGSASFTITQAALQQVTLAALGTTIGIGGSLTSTAQGDSITMVCKVPNLVWVAYAAIGNPTLV